MEENKPVIGLTWEPKVPSLSSITSSLCSGKTHINRQSISLYKPTSELVDGLYVPPNNPRKLNKLLRREIKDTTGNNWFDMPAPVVTPELKQDLQLLKLRGVIDPKRHYKKSDTKSKTLPKYFQVGTIVEPATDFYSSRLTRKERKTCIADELLSDSSLALYRKRKVREIEELNQPGGNAKWKIRGKQSQMRAKERRQSLSQKKKH